MIDLLKLIAVTEVEGGSEGTVDTLVGQEPTVEANMETSTEGTVTAEEQKIIDKYNIDGEDFSVDEIREWKKGNMRQSDYTKKTTELANKRKEMNEAMELYEYLSSKPELVAKLSELDSDNPVEVAKAQKSLDPMMKELTELKQKMAIKEIDMELTSITDNDKSVSDVELLEIANEMKVPLRVAYDLWKGRNMDKVIKQKELELKRQLADEVKKNADVTRTAIKPTDGNNEVGSNGLSEEQVAFANKIGMSLEDYKKYSTNPW